MDGTFNTVLVIFYQLYNIYIPIGKENSRVLSFVYSLTTSKLQEIYKCLFEKLIDFAAKNSIDL